MNKNKNNINNNNDDFYASFIPHGLQGWQGSTYSKITTIARFRLRVLSCSGRIAKKAGGGIKENLLSLPRKIYVKTYTYEAKAVRG